MAWIVLVIAGFLETGWAIGMKYSEGFTKPIPSAITVCLIVISLFMLSFALRSIPVGTGYAVWTGIGTVGTVILGIVFFAEPATFARLGCIGLILAGIIGLKLVTST